MLITKKEVKKQYEGLNQLQKDEVTIALYDIVKHPLWTKDMKACVAGLILFTDLAKYDG